MFIQLHQHPKSIEIEEKLDIQTCNPKPRSKEKSRKQERVKNSPKQGRKYILFSVQSIAPWEQSIALWT